MPIQARRSITPTNSDGSPGTRPPGALDERASLRGRRGLLVVLLTGQLMANMDSAIVNVAAPAVRSGLVATDAELELVVGVYILTYALLLTVGARAGDLRGYRTVYLAGVLCSPSYHWCAVWLPLRWY